jgi:hypothetical protein
MAFRIKPPYKIDNTPRYEKKEEPGVLGRANKNGTIVMNMDITDPEQRKEVDDHEMVHVEQFKDFEKSDGNKGLNYTNDSVTWQGETYPRKNGKIKYKGTWKVEGHPSFPWEQEAYKTNKK